MKISLIMATLGRTKEIYNLLDSLVSQTYKNFELIVVDQNEHYEVKNIIDKFLNKLDIKYIRSNIKGLSINRNIGLKYCDGDIVAFPDDDCFYSNNVLEEVYKIFMDKDIKLALIEAIDPVTNEIYISFNLNIIRKNIIKYSLSCNIFLKYDRNYLFDEKLGVGTYFSSGEETDYLWQQLSSKDKIIFIKDAYLYHLKGGYNALTFRKAYKYGLGFGAIFKKDIFLRKNYGNIILFLNYLLRSIGGILISRNKKMYIGSFFGRIIGFIKYK
ncbi:glycosyltransferase family 2 protein [Gallibacterium melopsittaci]|uniref:Glycosyltransferase family 2 protein n=1 Tax=Gallibacterium melopsittaci TaxID=516063 RepID=A0ABV6HSZ0_9PAST